MQPFGHNGHWPKIGDCAPLGEGELGPHLTVSPRLRPSSVPSGIRLATIEMNRKLGAVGCAPCPFGDGELGPYLTQFGQGQGLPVCQVSS